MRHLIFIIAAAFLVWAAGADPAGAPEGSHSAPPAAAATPHLQPAFPNPSPAALAAAKELVSLQMPEGHYAEGMIAVLPTFVGPRLRASGLSAERQRAVLAALADEARKIDETWMRDATARLYAETFCEADLTAFVAFFRSDFGKRWSDKQIDLFRASSALGYEWGRVVLAPRIMPRLAELLAKEPKQANP
ncbi:MAG: DUF2059 domain-containing protein [Caulobacterales bacterium]|jgi:hypothetical protein